MSPTKDVGVTTVALLFTLVFIDGYPGLFVGHLFGIAGIGLVDRR